MQIYLKEKAKKMNRESNIQCNFVKAFRVIYPDLSLLLFAIPNGSSRNKLEAFRLKREGVVKGVADMILMLPRCGFHALCLEFKRKEDYIGVGGKVCTRKTYQSAEQVAWQKAVEEQGYKYCVVYSVDDALSVVRKYINEEL